MKYPTLQILELLKKATLYKKIQWSSLSDYMFYNARNKAIVNHAELFSQSDIPTMIDDPPKVNLSASYYCEYGDNAFCLMYTSQVLQVGEPATDYYELMIQYTPYRNFGTYSTTEETMQSMLYELAKLAKLQAFSSLLSPDPLLKMLHNLQRVVDSFDPLTESMLTPPPPPPPYKYACVVDRKNNYIDFVLIHIEHDADGNETERIDSYELKEGERLLEVSAPGGFIKAHWNGAYWEESASEKEIAEYRRTHRHYSPGI